MTATAFNCSNCGHTVSRHTAASWPLFTKRCRDCECPGYAPNYRAAGGTK